MVSAHVVRTTEKDTDAARATRLIEEMTDELNRVTTEVPDISSIIAIDMNTTPDGRAYHDAKKTPHTSYLYGYA